MPMPFMNNPYYFQNNSMYPPQQYGQITPYPDRLAQLQSQQQQYNQPQYNPQMQTQPMGLSGEIVDSIDVVKAKNVDMSGNVTFYPKADLSEIYTKQLQMDGTSRIVTYRAVQPETPAERDRRSDSDVDVVGMFGQLKTDLLQEISDLKDMVNQISQINQNQKSQRGGKINDAS